MSLAFRISTRSNTTRLYNRKISDKPLASLPHEIDYGVGKLPPRTSRESDENNPAGFPHTRIDQLTEVLVLCDQDSLIANGFFSHIVVIRTR